METMKWGGVVTAVSPYSLAAGAATAQNNLQIRKPGQLIVRDGLSPFYGTSQGEVVYAIYRKSGGTATADVLYVWYRNFVTPAESQSPYYNAYTVLGVIKQSGSPVSYVINQIYQGTADSASYPSFAEDRHGNVYVFFGNDIPPQVHKESAALTVDAGLEAPTVAPQITPTGAGFFIERIDVVTGGGAYYKPPVVSITGGNPTRAAQARAVVQGGNVTAVEVTDGGSGYAAPPVVTASTSEIGRGFEGVGVLQQNTALYGLSNYDPINNVAVTPTLTGTYKAGETHAFTNFSLNAPQVTINVPPVGSTTQTPVAVNASWNPTTQRFLAFCPLIYSTRWTAGTTGAGTGATAAIEFTGIQLGYTVGTAAQNTVANWSRGDSPDNAYYLNADQQNLGFTASSSRYHWGLYGRDSLNISGWTGQYTGTAQDTYYPDYQKVSYWLFQGPYGQEANESYWTRYESTVVQIDQLRCYIDVTLLPSQKSTGSAYRVDANPVVRFYLRYCPASWCRLDEEDFNGRFECFRYYEKTAVARNKPSFWIAAKGWNIAEPQKIRAASTVPAGATTITLTPASMANVDVGLELVGNPLDGRFAQGTYITNKNVGTNQITLSRATTGTINANSELYLAFAFSTVQPPAGGTFKGSGEFDNEPNDGYLPRPIVDFYNSASADQYGFVNNTFLSGGSYEVLNAGDAEFDTRFRIRFKQGYANDQRYRNRAPGGNPDQYLTGVAHDPLSTGATFGAANYRDIEFGAFTASNSNTTSWVPGDVFGTPTLNLTGSGYALSDKAGVELLQRTAAANSVAFTPSKRYVWTAITLQASQPTDRIASVTILNAGSNYFAPPSFIISATGGFGLQIEATVDPSTGKISAINVLDGGEGYTAANPPRITTSETGATLTPVLRPAMRGVYRCAYRFADWSETAVATTTITATTPALKTVTVASAAGIKPGMVLESTLVPFMSKIVSVAGTTLTISRTPSAFATPTAVTVRDMERPITYSNFSPIVDVDCGPNVTLAQTGQLIWGMAGVTAPQRATVVEFFRTSGDQSLVFYRLEQYGRVSGGSVTIVGSDTLTDEELFDPDRPFYAALPVVLPNGGLNAYRFGVPRNDMKVCVAYQDRLWYAVSTSGKDINTIFFSEYDEFESCPDINELPIQNNQKITDYLTGLIPYGSTLLAMQNSHAYSVAFNTDPAVDPVIQLVAHRGLLQQRCWDIYDDLLYAIDERGIYTITRNGEIESLSDPIRDMFDERRIVFSLRELFFLKIDYTTGILRAFVVLEEPSATGPNVALCYHIANKTWWTESYPNMVTAAGDYRLIGQTSDTAIYGAADGNLYRLTGTADQSYRSITSVTITNAGSGYTTPPRVRVASNQSGQGAKFFAVVADGAIKEIVILEGGANYGLLTPVLTSGQVTGYTFDASVTLTIDPPNSGTTATATATTQTPAIIKPPGSALDYMSVGYQYKTGNMELLSDDNTKNGDQFMDRSVTVTYRPTAADSTLALREYFNNSVNPRVNVFPRDRNTGFVHDTSGAQTTLNMKATRSDLGLATGVARAIFGGRTSRDMGGSDRHIAVELYGHSQTIPPGTQPPKPLFYALKVAGVRDGE